MSEQHNRGLPPACPATLALTTLTSHYFPYLTLRDLHILRTTSKSIHDSLEFIEYNYSRDGNDYLVPFPGFPGVLSTEDDVRNGAGLFCHQLASLHAMRRAENCSLAFGALRGGILGDAPGLGKTITMLSLICSTAGKKPTEPPEFYDSASISEHWKLMRVNICFKLEILKALRPIRDWTAPDEGMNLLYIKVAEMVSPPYSNDRFPTLQSMEQYVYSQMKSVVPQHRLDLFRRNVVQLKAGFDKRNRRFFNSDKGRRLMMERNLIPSSASLIIVPDALLEHWAEQIRRHVNLEVFADPNNNYKSEGRSHGVVWIDGVGDLATARFPLNHKQTAMPSAFHFLGFMIVVVPFSRIKEQFGSRKRKRNGNADDDGSESRLQSSLMHIRWLRIVVDEGHELGENEAESEVTEFINELAAERRWVLSGTPTTGDEDSPDFNSTCLDQLQRLLYFLRHETYGIIPSNDESSGPTYDYGRKKVKRKDKKKQAKSAWVTNVKLPFLKKEESGRLELFRVLKEIMVMHKKEDLSLPKPVFKQADINVWVPMQIQSTILNAIREDKRDCDVLKTVLRELNVDLDKRKLELQTQLPHAIKAGGAALIDFLVRQYQCTDVYQNLVDEAQGNYISTAVVNARSKLDARGGPIISASVTPITAASGTHDEDRRPIKAVVYSNSRFNLADVTEYLLLSFKPENIAELNAGKIANMSYELGRFRNGQKEVQYCPICGGCNECIGNYQSCSNMLMEVADSEGRSFLIEPQRVRRAISIGDANPGVVGNRVDPARLQGESLFKYGSVTQKHWRVGDALSIDLRDPHPILKKRWSEEVWESYGVEKCRELIQEDSGLGRDGYLGQFPTFEEDVNEVFVELKKWQHCGRFHGKSRWYSGPTLDDAPIQTEKEDVFILCLDASLAHGLDLSFVTHIFLLEPIDDAALLEQVTSRAHRLGCTGPVVVETVNVWAEMGTALKEAAKALSSTSVQTGESTTTSTVVCDHCYRSFENLDKAEIHEKTCDRNPNGSAIVDPFHLSAVYRDLRPPPPILARRTLS